MKHAVLLILLLSVHLGSFIVHSAFCEGRPGLDRDDCASRVKLGCDMKWFSGRGECASGMKKKK